MSAREVWKTDQLSAAADTKWTMPYRADLDPDLVDVAKTRRLVYKERVYGITGAKLIERKAGVVMETLAKVG